MKYVFRAIWAVGVIFYAVAYFGRMHGGDPSLRVEDANALMLIAGSGALAWRPWPVTPSQ